MSELPNKDLMSDIKPQQMSIDPQAAKRVQQDLSIQQKKQSIKHIVAIQSGKGGVGKSTVTWNLALEFANRGYEIGILDADITGPSIPILAGIVGQDAMVKDRKLIPNKSNGVNIISMDLLVDMDTPVIWRGSLKTSAIKQFISDVAWPPLDMLFIDLPPGTSDEPLTVAQMFEDISGTVIVTTPQKVATHDVVKSIGFASKIGMPILGIIENMSGLKCPHCGEIIPVFKQGGGKEMADNLGLVLLGTIPLDPAVVIQGDSGEPSSFIEGDFKEAFSGIAAKVAKLLEME